MTSTVSAAEIRKKRCYDPRMYCVSFEYNAQCKTGKCNIRGTQGIVYTILVKEHKTLCSCLDYKRRKKPCKHIYYIAYRMCSLTENDNYTPSKLYSEFLIWLERNRERKQRQPSIQRREWKGEMCAICLDAMDDEKTLIWCQSTCGNSVHQTCFDAYCSTQGRIRCVFCRRNPGMKRKP